MNARRLTADYILLVNKGRKHIMRADLFEKDKHNILNSGWKPATTDQYQKSQNITFEPIDDMVIGDHVEPEKKKRGRKKREYNADEEKIQDTGENY